MREAVISGEYGQIGGHIPVISLADECCFDHCWCARLS
jgi:hypothetical protein